MPPPGTRWTTSPDWIHHLSKLFAELKRVLGTSSLDLGKLPDLVDRRI